MRNVVNFGLLLSFVTLAVTGMMAFYQPFSLVTTRVHIVSGAATFVLVGLHLVSRMAYFRTQLSFRIKSGISRLSLLLVFTGWGLLLAMAVQGWAPVRTLVNQGYEANYHAAIVRASSLSGFRNLPHNRLVVARMPGEKADAAVSLFVGFDEKLKRLPAVAVWAETSAGTMIETLYLDPQLAFSEQPEWGGKPTPRNRILPIWRHRYTAVSGVDPEGRIDAMTGATGSHDFSLDNYLILGEEKEFVLCVEINQPNDANEHFSDSHIGQPSLLYTAYIELDSPQPYALLELTGHSGGAEQSGAIQYDLEQFTTATELVDLLLAKSEPVPETVKSKK